MISDPGPWYIPPTRLDRPSKKQLSAAAADLLKALEDLALAAQVADIGLQDWMDDPLPLSEAVANANKAIAKAHDQS